MRRSLDSMSRRAVVLGAAAAGVTATAALPALADTYPSKPIRLVVPFPPGGAVDLYARTVQSELQKRLGQAVVIDNRTGASGMIGADSVAKAPPDGYTLLVGNIAVFAMNSATFRKVPYDPVKDFTPILQTVMVPYVLVVSADLPARSVPELLALAKSRRGALAYGSSGSGSAQHMAAELFKSKTGAEMTHIPYKGVGAMVTDLIAGHVQVAFADQASMMPHVQAGKLRLLGVVSAKRAPDLPDVPTVAEALKLSDFVIAGWQGVAGPAGLPEPVVQRLNEAFNAAQSAPAVKDAFAKAGLHLVGGSPSALTRQMQTELSRWTRIALDVGAVAD
jgi:tripartite-type tricarboxylate transporter receptor subunit TctC